MRTAVSRWSGTSKTNADMPREGDIEELSNGSAGHPSRSTESSPSPVLSRPPSSNPTSRSLPSSVAEELTETDVEKVAKADSERLSGPPDRNIRPPVPEPALVPSGGPERSGG